MPRDYWWLNRANYQPGDEFFARLVQSIANGVEALAGGESVDDVFARLEAFDEVRRIDRSAKPAGYHGGFVSDGELEQLRRIRNVVRLGRVTRIDPDQSVLERGRHSDKPRLSAHRLLRRRHSCQAFQTDLRRRPDHPAVGAIGPADLQLVAEGHRDRSAPVSALIHSKRRGSG